jgi:hypothetical protein
MFYLVVCSTGNQVEKPFSFLPALAQLRMSYIKEDSMFDVSSTEGASQVIAQLIQALAKVEASKKSDTIDKMDNTMVSAPETYFLDDDRFAFQSDLNYGSYSGINHG